MDRAIVQGLLVFSVGWLVRYAAAATGNKQMAGAIKMVTGLICISIIAPALWDMVSGIAEALAAAKEIADNAEEKFKLLEWLIWFGAPGGKPGEGG